MKRIFWLVFIAAGFAACSSSAPQIASITDVTVRQTDLPNIYEPLDPTIVYIANEGTGTSFAYGARRSQVLGYTVQNPNDTVDVTLQQVIESFGTPEEISDIEPLPDIQLDVIGDEAIGSTYLLPATDDNDEPYTMRVNTIVLKRGDVISMVSVTFQDGSAAPVDIYAMARLLDSRIRELTP